MVPAKGNALPRVLRCGHGGFQTSPVSPCGAATLPTFGEGKRIVPCREGVVRRNNQRPWLPRRRGRWHRAKCVTEEGRVTASPPSGKPRALVILADNTLAAKHKLLALSEGGEGAVAQHNLRYGDSAATRRRERFEPRHIKCALRMRWIPIFFPLFSKL